MRRNVWSLNQFLTNGSNVNTPNPASTHTHITFRLHVIFRLLFLLLSPLVGLMDNVWLSLKGGLKSTSQIEAVCTWPQKLRPQLSIICPRPVTEGARVTGSPRSHPYALGQLRHINYFMKDD